MHRPITEKPLPTPPHPKVPRGSVSSLPSLRWRTPIRDLDLMDRSRSTTPGLPNRATTEGRAVVLLNQSGIGLPNLVAAQSRPRRIPSSTNNYRTSGHRSTATPMSNTHITITTTHDVFLDMYQVLASDRCRLLFTGLVMLLCPRSIRNPRRHQGYRWISTRFLLVGRSMDYRTRVTIFWAAMSTHSWVACSDLKMNSFLHITKKTANSYGKPMARPAHISDRSNIEHLHLILVPYHPAVVTLSCI